MALKIKAMMNIQDSIDSFSRVYVSDDLSRVYMVQGNSISELRRITELHSIEEACHIIECHYDNKKEELSNLLKSEKAVDYQGEAQERYNNIKIQIKNTAKNMIETDCDIEFENKLKTICQLKKSIYNDKNQDIVNARKHNGSIKYKIKDMEKQKQFLLNKIKTETIIDFLQK